MSVHTHIKEGLLMVWLCSLRPLVSRSKYWMMTRLSFVMTPTCRSSVSDDALIASWWRRACCASPPIIRLVRVVVHLCCYTHYSHHYIIHLESTFRPRNTTYSAVFTKVVLKLWCSSLLMSINARTFSVGIKYSQCRLSS